ncbi:LOW QUALITY PROTEIN: pyridine nucleotide-disulfide oxidoreductase domain-containing protein 2-like [Panulirus ornatus]|uniref:LOW QUALITY PROTEIN: pyridine nucleotide-disulfide oxidoreductase domain-containing protein 2-like n=1 Tax=Panulirus ornatus TaxID=150431 RepID=UPI003A864B3B
MCFVLYLSFSRQLGKCLTSGYTEKAKYDAIIVGGGHNGLVAATYLAKAGKSVCVLERRHILGGAAVTEEIIPGFKFSRASYVLGLLRPKVYEDLELKRHGLKVYPRDPSSYTPLHESNWQRGCGKSLILGSNEDENYQQIAQFSEKDAQALPRLESLLFKCAKALDFLVDYPPPDANKFFTLGLAGKIKQLGSITPLMKLASVLGKDIPQFYELMTAPATKILDQWLESEPLKATLATDSVIGTMCSPGTPGTGYVLLHHVMSLVCGLKGVWGYPEGGMGGVTQAMARAATEAGAHLFTNQPVKTILLGDKNEAVGVETEDGYYLYADTVLSNATANVTFLKLLPEGSLPPDFEASIKGIDYSSPVCKINVALKSIPNFKANPNTGENAVMPHHCCTIHLNCEKTELLNEAYTQAIAGQIPDNPMIEMTLPSSCDSTLAPPGCHVALFFTQYVPYTRADGRLWDENTKTEYANKIFNTVENYAPGFIGSIIGYEVLPPPDLEQVFGLTGGNIFHGAMTVDQMFISRPSPLQPGPFTPINGLFMCGAGAHPGGGVMGAAGRLAAHAVLRY